MIKKIKIFSFGLFLCWSSLGCGYSAQSLLPKHLRTIYVEPFKNSIDYTTEQTGNIYFPLLEVNVRNAIINRYVFDGNLRIKEKDKAGLILKGELIGYERDALRVSDAEDVEEYRVRIIIKLVLWDTTQKEVFWQEDAFAGEASYFVSGPKIQTEKQALDAAVVDLARRVVERTIENW